MNMYTTDENNDITIKNNSTTEDDFSDFKSVIFGLGGMSTNQLGAESCNSNANVDK